MAESREFLIFFSRILLSWFTNSALVIQSFCNIRYIQKCDKKQEFSWFSHFVKFLKKKSLFLMASKSLINHFILLHTLWNKLFLKYIMDLEACRKKKKIITMCRTFWKYLKYRQISEYSATFFFISTKYHSKITDFQKVLHIV